MGPSLSISRNIAKQIINNSVTIANSYVQNCTGTGSQVFGLKISSGCVANIGKIDLTDTQILNVKCVQNITTTNSMKADIAAQISQQALASAQSIGGPSLSFAESISIFSATAAETITTLYTQTCLSQANQSQNIKCTDPGTKLTVGAIDIANEQTVFTNCLASNNTVNNLVDGLTNIINQQTNAEEANSFSGFIIAGLFLVGIFAYIFIQTANGPIGWIIIAIVAVVVVAIVIYATVAFSSKLYPFNNKTNIN